jgi:hypothetical protein
MILATPRSENSRPKPELIAIIVIKPVESKQNNLQYNACGTHFNFSNHLTV